MARGERGQHWTAGLLALAFAVLASRAGAQATDTSRSCIGPCIGQGRSGLAPYPQTTPQDTGRRKAIEYSNTYGTFMTIHRIGSYFEIPLFVGEYFVGERLLKDERTNPDGRSSLKGPHSALAAGLGALFTVNTLTGVWALVESRHEPAGRTRRWVHTIAMLVADGGFVATAAAARSATRDPTAADNHRALAIGSMGLATAASVMMWLWKD